MKEKSRNRFTGDVRVLEETTLTGVRSIEDWQFNRMRWNEERSEEKKEVV